MYDVLHLTAYDAELYPVELEAALTLWMPPSPTAPSRKRNRAGPSFCAST